jgi:hypothetical protein
MQGREATSAVYTRLEGLYQESKDTLHYCAVARFAANLLPHTSPRSQHCWMLVNSWPMHANHWTENANAPHIEMPGCLPALCWAVSASKCNSYLLTEALQCVFSVSFSITTTCFASSSGTKRDSECNVRLPRPCDVRLPKAALYPCDSTHCTAAPTTQTEEPPNISTRGAHCSGTHQALELMSLF